jgi:predicted nuclease of restriction endonuclease-like RecB superfamily
LRFDSRGERDCYLYLLALEQAGEIKILGRQEKVYLTDAKILMKPDFKIMDLKKNCIVWVEFKGFETTDYNIKKRLWEYYGPGPLRVFKGGAKTMKMVDEVIPVTPLVR